MCPFKILKFTEKSSLEDLLSMKNVLHTVDSVIYEHVLIHVHTLHHVSVECKQ